MKILVLNCGSSSIKYKLYNMDNETVLAQGGVERIGIDGAFIKVTLPNGEKKQIMHDMPDHKEGVNMVFSVLLDKEIGAIKSLDEIDAVGHRIVQGGDKFCQSVIVDQSVEDGIEELCDLAPVHNAGHLKCAAGVRVRQRIPLYNARLRLSVCRALRALREVSRAPLWFPRHQPPLCVPPCVRDVRQGHKDSEDYHLPYRQRRECVGCEKR